MKIKIVCFTMFSNVSTIYAEDGNKSLYIKKLNKFFQSKLEEPLVGSRDP